MFWFWAWVFPWIREFFRSSLDWSSEEICWLHDLDAMERMKLQKALVSCQDDLCVTTQGEIKELVVFWIPHVTLLSLDADEFASGRFKNL